MNLSYFYNNQEDSDIKIQLNNGDIIYCHKIVLKISCEMILRMLNNKMKETNDNIVKFPDHSDVAITTIIKYFYNVNDIDYNKLRIDEWYSIFEFANYLMLDDFIEKLEKHIEKYVECMNLLWISCELRNKNLMKKTALLVIRESCVLKDDDYEILKTISLEKYNNFRLMWLENKFNNFVLLKLDCYYCSLLNKDNNNVDEILGKYVDPIDVGSFNINELFECITLPVISENRIIRKLFYTIAQLN
jgi:hypothetical protein